MSIRVVNLRNYELGENEILIKVDRSSVLGNPFKMHNENMRDEVCDKYASYFDIKVKERGDFRNEVIRIYRMVRDGRDIALGCWCYPKRCHAEYIKAFIESHLPAPTVDTEHANSQMFCIIAGSRDITDYQFVLDTIRAIKDSTNKSLVIVHGGARGVDQLAGQAAAELGIPVKVFPANWNRFGNSAGYRRNEEMHKFIARFKHRGCVCIWDGKSKGTAHNFELAKKYNNPLQIVRYIPLDIASK